MKVNLRGEPYQSLAKYFKLTQAELAARAGMRESDLARPERSKTDLSTTDLTKLAEAMGIDVEQLTD